MNETGKYDIKQTNLDSYRAIEKMSLICRIYIYKIHTFNVAYNSRI